MHHRMKENINNSNNLLVILAVIVIVLSLISIFINVLKIPEIRKVTGYASGYVNLTINTQITLNVTNAYVNFSSGTVGIGATNATLTTRGDAAATVVNGNWTTTARALAIANVGNINCSIALNGVKTAATFFGGLGEELYQWNVSSKDVGACGAWGENSAKNVFANVNTTAATVCNKLDFNLAKNEMWIDFMLVVPYNGTSAGAQSDIITISANTQV